MARGFGSTFGAGTTDIIVTAFSGKSTLRSYFARYIKNGVGGSSLGNMFGTVNTAVGTGRESFQCGADPTIQFIRGFTTTNGVWNINNLSSVSSTTWHTVSLTYDGGSTSNAPVTYLDGAVIAGTVVSVTPVGTIDNTLNTMQIGNFAAGTRNWDGVLADFAIWDAILTAAEAAALDRGCSPLMIRPASLVEYVPMLRNNVSMKLAAPTITGTVVQPHPRIIMPRPVTQRKITATAAAAFKPAWSYGSNLPVLGTGTF